MIDKSLTQSRVFLETHPIRVIWVALLDEDSVSQQKQGRTETASLDSKGNGILLGCPASGSSDLHLSLMVSSAAKCLLG